METLKLSDSIKEILEYAHGKTFDEKVSNLIFSDLDRRLHLCIERILGFEKKHGMSFEEFEKIWQGDKIPDKHSHDVESDYMEWESLDDEHRILLSLFKKVNEEIKSK